MKTDSRTIRRYLRLLLSTAVVSVAVLAPVQAPAQAATNRHAMTVSGLEETSGPAVAADDPVSCLSGWHFLKAAAVNRWLQPDSTGFLWANGNRNNGPWNQEFLMCQSQSPTWITPQHHWWAFYSNLTKHWVERVSGRSQLDANGGRAADAAAEWHVCNYDNNFVLISWTSNFNFMGATTPDGPVTADTLSPGGNQLFNIDPSVLSAINPC
jgi:hypothetical protein